MKHVLFIQHFWLFGFSYSFSFFFLFHFLGAATGVLWSSRGLGSPLAISFIDHAYRISITSPLSPLAHCIITSFFRFSVCVLVLVGIIALYTTLGEWGK